MKNTQRYPTDLTDCQWDCIKELIPAARARRTTAHPGDASGHQCDLVYCGQWLSMAHAAAGVPGVAKCVQLRGSSGVMMERGNGFTTRFERKSVDEQVVTSSQPQGP
jgi:hypothetical protein